MQTIVSTLGQQKRYQPDVKLADDLPPLFADEAKFKQIMYNLLSNAIKFTPDGGRVTAETALDRRANGRRTSPGLADNQVGLRVTVSDTGIGVRPQDQERIFAEFEQVDSSYGRQQQGTGLGLALTKRLIELHGGCIWVESRGIEGQGSVFVFWLPLQSEPAKPSALRASPGETVRPILFVVSNDSSTRARVRDYLGDAGYDVQTSANLTEARRYLEMHRPFALLLDESQSNESAGAAAPEFPANLPVVLFKSDETNRLGFRRVVEGRGADGPLRPRLIDTVRGSGCTTGPEVKTVLVIEDDQAFLTLLTRTLVLRGFHVLQAVTGKAGLALAIRHRPGVIVLDLGLPDLGGPEIAERLRAHPQTRNIPVLIQTGTILNEEERQQLAGNVQSVTSKTEPGKLLTEVERWEEQSLAADTAGVN